MSENETVVAVSEEQPVVVAPEEQPVATESPVACPDDTEGTVATPVAEYVTTKFFYQTVVVVSLVASVLSLFVYDRFFATKIATFDFPGYLMSVREKMALAGNAADAEKVLMTGLSTAENIVKNVPRNYVVISGDAILGDSKPALVLYRYPKKQQGSEQAPVEPSGQTPSTEHDTLQE